jgi:predicted lipoprotein with Yx(FWY)xxD motif
MRAPRTFLLLIVIAAVALGACGSDDDKTSATTQSTIAAAADSGSPVVIVGENATLGRIVVDDQGRTVYTLTDAAGAAVACEGSCLEAWPPVLLQEGISGTGGKGVKGVAVVTTPEGEQAAITGLPLYTFSGDAKPGDAIGNGLVSFGGTWHVVELSGAATSDTTKPTTSTTGAYGY